MSETKTRLEMNRAELRSWLDRVDGLATINPLNVSAVRNAQDQISRYLMLNARALLALALVVAESQQCESCRGYGYAVEWVASDEQRRHRCTVCGGTGAKAELSR